MTELSDDDVFGKRELSDDQVFGDPMPDALQASVPEAFLDRVRAGQALTRITKAALAEGREGLGEPTPTGFSNETLQHLIDTGIFHDPAKGSGGPVQFANEAIMMPAAQLWQAVNSGVAAGIHGAGGAIGQLVEEFGGSQGTGNRAKNEVINAGNWAMIEGGMGRFSRPAATPNGVMDQPIGGLPKPEDFANGAKVLAEDKPIPPQMKNPIIGFHGSADIISNFDPEHARLQRGVFFSDNPKLASKFAEGMAVDNDPVRIYGEDSPKDIKDWVREHAGNNEAERVGSLIDEAEKLDFNDRRAELSSQINNELRKLSGLSQENGPSSPNVTRAVIDLGRSHEVDLGGKFDWDKEREAIDYARANGFDSVTFKNSGEEGNFYTVFRKDQIDKMSWGDVVETNLRRLWQEDGIHPAEAVHDAERDAFLRHDLTTEAEPIVARPRDVVGELPAKGVAPANIGADGKLYVGESNSQHFELSEKYADEVRRSAELKPGDYTWKDTGFVNADGEFMNREQALEWVNANEKKIRPAENMGNQLDALDYREQVPEKLRAPAKASIPSTIESGIQDFIDNSPEGTANDLGAAVSTAPPDVPLSVTPARPPGRLAATFQAAANKLFDLGRDAQMKLAPMATGTRDSIAMMKDFANSMRRNRWDWSRIDDDIAKRFTPDSRRRMWNAADEESLSLRLGEPAHMREHQGLATLDPEERAAVDELQTRAQNAWVRARDIGMVEGEGLPSYTPRMILNVAGADAKQGHLPLDGIGANLRTSTANLLRRKHLEAEETEAAAKAKYGDDAILARDIRVLPLATAKLEDAIAGRTLLNNIKEYGERTGVDTVVEGAIPAGSDVKWFTLDHPAFKIWRPKFAEIEGKLQAVKDQQGNIVFEQVPLYVHGDFEGPFRAVLSQKSGPLYAAAMSIKGKTMSLIMNSPMIHNAVEFGRAFPAMPLRIVQSYFEGNRAKNNVPLMHEAIDAGLVPIGHRFFNQDITSIMESPDLTPGRSWTAKALGETIGRLPQKGMTTEEVMAQVKGDIDKAGDFWHNTLLWDRIGDLQMGLYVNMQRDMIAKGIDRQTASRMAAHMANRYAGSLPKEAMSDAATKAANLMLFSRTFTMGNLGVLKDAFTGLPKDVLAQIERDLGKPRPPPLEGVTPQLTTPAEGLAYAKGMARRKAFSVVMMDIGLLYIANSVVQSALTVMRGDRTFDQEAHGYIDRYGKMLEDTKANPLSLVTPLSIAGGAMGGAAGGLPGAIGGTVAGAGLSLMRRLSSTQENEPGKEDRLKVGYAKDGTAIYARSPFGKIGEEFIGYLGSPLDMAKRKEGTLARPMLQVFQNDKGFGRKIYDPDAETPAERAFAMWQVIKHIAGAQLPEGQISAVSDLVKGEGDSKVAAMQALGPFGGITFSKGAPGGPAVGEMYHAKSQFEFRVNQAMPDIRKQILRGDIPGAQARMTELGMDASYSRWVLKTTLNPATRLGSKAMRDFFRTATPEQRDRMTRIQGAPQPAP